MTRKLGSGDRFQVASFEHSAWQDAGEANRRGRQGPVFGPGGELQLPDSNEGIILVKSPADLKRYSILGLRGTIPRTTGSAQEIIDFQNQIALRGETPATITTGRFCVLQVDAVRGEVVPAMVSGATPVRLSVTAITDEFAEIDPTAADPTKWLKTGGSGSAQILYQPEVVGEQWGVVRLGNRAAATEVRFVRHGHLPSAYGATRTGITGSAAVTNGNINPSNLQIYPKLAQKVYRVGTSTLSEWSEQEDENIYVANLGMLPLTAGEGIATKITDDDPNFGTVYGIGGEYMPSHYGAAAFEWVDSQGLTVDDEWPIEDGATAIFLRGLGLGLQNPDTSSWAISWNQDVILTHMGAYEVTFGYEGYQATLASYTQTSGAQSAGTAHTHGIKEATGCTVQFGLHKNFQPGVDTPGVVTQTNHVMKNYHPGPNTVTGQLKRNSFERTVQVVPDLEPWHGQHHTRLSLFAKMTSETHDTIDDIVFNIVRAWLYVKPCRYTSEVENTGNVDKRWTGANQYPGGYDGIGDTHVWYGGGSEPDQLDQDGVVI